MFKTTRAIKIQQLLKNNGWANMARSVMVSAACHDDKRQKCPAVQNVCQNDESPKCPAVQNACQCQDIETPKCPEVHNVCQDECTESRSAVCTCPGTYMNNEYFCFGPYDFYDANIEMEKFRLPQPIAVDTRKHKSFKSIF